ncbi:hypothetical protein, partial [Xenococcus sp. PCC 7305]|uniref:hypothetical protein n=1 Tax=Xenococcus sp. PCC 7305 TaxID=102125 RepID=UPI001EE6C3F8
GRRIKLLLTYPFRLNSSTSLSGTGHSGESNSPTMPITFCLLPSFFCLRFKLIAKSSRKLE